MQQDQGSTKKHLIKAAGLLGLMTLSSRVLGMIRDIISAKQYGTTWQFDAFVYAFMLPNFFRRIIGEGALSSAFIPVYSEEHEQRSREHAFRFANVTACLAAVGLAAFILMVELVIRGLLAAHCFSPRIQLTVELLRFMFPYLWFMSLYALMMGILNCHRIFFFPALAPIILDLVWIAGVLIVPLMSPVIETQLNWLRLFCSPDSCRSLFNCRHSGGWVSASAGSGPWAIRRFGKPFACFYRRFSVLPLSR
jgi:putative peptidoglycan lipid II flippase